MIAHINNIFKPLSRLVYTDDDGARIGAASLTTGFGFYALHGMQTRSYDENSVRPSVRLSVKRVHCDKTKEKSVQIFTPYERSFILVF